MENQITVNNETISWKENMTVDDVLKAMNYTFRLIIVKINGELVKREDYQNQTVPDGAEVKVIHLIAGG